MDDSLLVWIAAIESGFVFSEEWVSWADSQIVNLDEPPVWILDLSFAHSAQDALSVLWSAGRNISPKIWEQLDWTGLCLGFIFLRFERGDFNMLELLIQAGRKTDASNSQIGCEAFYLLANEIDGRGPTTPSDRPLVDRVNDLFHPLAVQARQSWNQLQQNSQTT